MDVTPLLPLLRDRRLIKCPYCTKLSPEADARCHYCHVRINGLARKNAIAARKRSERLGGVAALVVLIVLVLIFSYISIS
ncbi:MAG: hypothetical protein R3268_04860 [Acidiferrobacterales bacterium]|nr:hypothetical protein [Acidiferrobacterales bacterium]